jgi:deazaflavin-dependent oxidoreductase (nitroreductase family)
MGAADGVSEELLDRIKAGLEHPPKPDFLSDAEWQGIIASRNPSIIRMAGNMQVDMYREGVPGADMAQGGPVLVLTTVGRRTGNEVATCVNYMPHDDELLVVGSFAAFTKSPFWVLNLEADPHCVVELQGRSWNTVARPVAGPERAQLWPAMVQHFPLWGHFQQYCRREFPVWALPLEPAG